MNSLKTIHQRQSNLCEDQVWAKSLRDFNKAASVANCTDNSEFAG
jgi:hypothetical protein